MIIESNMQVQPRRSGKTEYLRKIAVNYATMYHEVIFISFNRISNNTHIKYFRNLNVNVSCKILDDLHILLHKSQNKHIPSEYLLVNNGEIYVMLDEYDMMDKNKLDRLLNDAKVSPHKFVMIGRTS